MRARKWSILWFYSSRDQSVCSVFATFIQVILSCRSIALLRCLISTRCSICKEPTINCGTTICMRWAKDSETTRSTLFAFLSTSSFMEFSKVATTQMSELLLCGQSTLKRRPCVFIRSELGKSSISCSYSTNMKSISNMTNIGTTSFAEAACLSTLFTTSGKQFQSLFSWFLISRMSKLLQSTASSLRQDSLILTRPCGSQLSSLRCFRS